MAVPWPSDVPQRAIAGTLKEKPQNNVRRFQPEIGTPKQRRVTSLKSRMFSFQIAMDETQVADFIEFFEDDLFDGTLEFTREHPRTLESGTFIFAGDYEVTHRQYVHYFVTVEIMQVF